MPLQALDLVMVALGVENDPRPVAEQEILVDGVHLRWAFARDKGFPWYGYYLFRRVRGKRGGICLGPELDAERTAGGRPVETFAAGQLASPTPLTYTDDFPAPGQLEVDLDDRDHVRLDLPTDRAAFHVEVTIGFKEPRREIRCIDFRGLAGHVLAGPFERGGIRVDLPHRPRRLGSDLGVFARPAHPRPTRPDEPDVARGDARDEAVLLLSDEAVLRLPEPARWVDLDLEVAAGTVEAFDENGDVVTTKRLAHAQPGADVRIIGDRPIAGFRLTPREGPTWVHKLCFPISGGARRPIEVTALASVDARGRPGAADVEVDEELVSGNPGDVVTVELRGDRITALRVSGGAAALIDICWTSIDEKFDAQWEPVPHCPQPLTLPIRHPDYPAWTGAEDTGLAETTGTDRVRYGNGAGWQGAPFADLYEQCLALVAGGPAVPMAAPARAATNLAATNPAAGTPPPTLRQLHPLDNLLLGAIHPPIAQMLGLAWVDEDAQPGVPYDYLIVADHGDVAQGDPLVLRDHLVQNGVTSDLDAWISHGFARAPSGPLATTTEVRAHALPGGLSSGGPGTEARIVAGNAGLTWHVPQTSWGFLAPNAPVLHHVWRGDATSNNTPTVPAEATDWLTKSRTILATRSLGAPTTGIERPSDWPPFPLRYVDYGLPEGWYVYQVSGVDVFGRFSSKSDFAAWWQWAPEPVPRPWYYAGMSVAAIVHAEAVRILDKRRPPPPTGLAPYALDPDDPMVFQDAAYQAWRATPGLPAGVVGLRVSWRWPVSLQRQAPDVTEFRLYWHDGMGRPSSWTEPRSWSRRFIVCAYAGNVTVQANGDRDYELFLPLPGGAVFAAGIPLTPSAATPVAYANVTVSAADDAAHSADTWPGGGAFAGRPGNESTCVAPQPVARVWRRPPDPPQVVVDSDLVYATPADWHGRSFHTFRWPSRPNLQAHVWRAVDEAVFASDWVVQPRAQLTVDNGAFPDEAVEPTWNDAKKQRVCDALNAIAALLPASPSSAVKARTRPAALALYRALSDDALRVLASLPGAEKAFVQLTIKPLDRTTNPDRRGPDDPAGYAERASLCAYIDQLDGRATNRYVYRGLYVDRAHNRSGLGPCGPPVRLPNVVAPRAPLVTKALGGERVVTVTWASNREPDLLEYRVYRTTDEASLGEVRTMTRVATVAADPDPAARPAEVVWNDASPPPFRDIWYRVVAVDRPAADARGGGGNVSAPSASVRARAFDNTPPGAIALTTAEWVRIDEAGAVRSWATPVPAGAVWTPAVRVAWAAPPAGVHVLVQHKPASAADFGVASGWIGPSTTSFVHTRATAFEANDYRLKVRNEAGNVNTAFLPTTVQPHP